ARRWSSSKQRRQPHALDRRGLKTPLTERILADFPLTRHLINYWDRRWNRQAFLSGSVFDYASDLRGLYEDWHA
ncbi:MAG: hypothetical protein K2X00_14510, partial [Nitrospiraceae bacterium]|nr:hypothetical protein [Nitrospiraceae bacterium]